MVPSPETIAAFVTGRVMVTVPAFPSVHETGKTTVALLQLDADPRQVTPLSLIENCTFSCVAPNVVWPLPWRPVASTY